MKQAYEGLKRAKKSVCQLYEVSYRPQLETMEQYGERIFQGAQALMSDLLDIAHQIVELSSSEHFCLSLPEMTHYVDLLSNVVSLKMHGHLIYYALQLKPWFELF